MRDYALSTLRQFISPSIRFELRKAVAWSQELLARTCVWRWEIATLQRGGDIRCYDILYAGRKSQRDLAKALLGIDGAVSPTLAFPSSRTALVSEVPFPGALHVPGYLSAIVPLGGRPIEEITARYSRELQRTLRKLRPRYRLQQVVDEAEIDRVDREMLQPYARARHGAAAAQLARHEVHHMALQCGRLDLLLLDDKVVGCQLGCVITRAGKCYWSINRFGYTEAVFSDPKRLRETNSFNNHLALEWAIENGFDYYDIGICLGRPDDGLLEWKRRRGGEVDTLGSESYFYVRLPETGAAQLLWDAPLFAVEHRSLTLHLGLPEGPSDEEVANRYREMGFGGLSKVYLHCARQAGESLLDTLRSRYTHQKIPPVVVCVSCKG